MLLYNGFSFPVSISSRSARSVDVPLFASENKYQIENDSSRIERKRVLTFVFRAKKALLIGLV
jgi:hypothetical protein